MTTKLLFFALLFILSLLFGIVQARQDRFYWNVDVTERPTDLSEGAFEQSQLLERTDLTYVKQLNPYANYLFVVNIVNEFSCDACSTEFSNIGGYPVIRGSLQQGSIQGESLTDEWHKGIIAGASRWFIPFSTSKPGSFKVIIDTNNKTIPRLYHGGLVSAEFGFLVGITSVSNGQTVVSTLEDTSNISWENFNLSYFRCHWAPQASSMWICNFQEPKGSKVIHTEDEFQNTHIGDIGIPSQYLSACGASNPSKDQVVKAIALKDSILAFLSNGVVVNGTSRESSEFRFERVTASCFDHVSLPKQDAPEFIISCSPAFLINNENHEIYRWTLYSTDSISLEPTGKTSLVDALKFDISDIEFIEGAASTVSCDNSVFLVRNKVTEVYSLLNLRDRGWVKTFDFPKQVFDVPTRVWAGVDMVGTGISIPVELNSMAYHRSLNSDLFIWGTSLMYSADGGNTFLLIKAFGNGVTITSFDTDSHSSFAFSTSDHRVYFGDVGSNRVVRLREASIDDNLHVYPFFEMGNRFKELVIERNPTTNELTFNTAPVHLDRLMIELDVETASCPYRNIVFEAPQDPLYLRQKTRFTTLPEAIFLDRHQKYTFKMFLYPSSATPLTDLLASFSLSDPYGVKIKSIRHVDRTKNYVKYTITIEDVGEQGLNYPGKNMKTSSIRIFIQNADFSCAASQGDEDKMPLSYTMNIFSGCPPNQETKAKFNFTKINLHCPKVEEGIPCAYYENPLDVQIDVSDLITLDSKSFEDLYYLKAIGGGPTADDITLYTEEEVGRYNLNYSTNVLNLIYSVDGEIEKISDGIPIVKSENNNIRFLCKLGSPCYGLKPTAHPFASYYLLFKMTSKGIENDNTYCIRETTFIVHLYGIPLDFNTSAMAMCIVTLILVIFTLGILHYAWNRELKLYAQVGDGVMDTDNIFGGGMDGLPEGLGDLTAPLPQKKMSIAEVAAMRRKMSMAKKKMSSFGPDFKNSSFSQSGYNGAGANNIVASAILGENDTNKPPQQEGQSGNNQRGAANVAATNANGLSPNTIPRRSIFKQSSNSNSNGAFSSEDLSKSRSAISDY